MDGGPPRRPSLIACLRARSLAGMMGAGARAQVTVTSHVSAVTQPSDVAEVLSDNLARYEEGGVEALRFVFDWEGGY